MPIISGGPVSRGRENFMYPILGAFMVGSWYKVGRVTRTFFPKKRKKKWATHCESVWTNSSLLNEVKTFLISDKPYGFGISDWKDLVSVLLLVSHNTVIQQLAEQ